MMVARGQVRNILLSLLVSTYIQVGASRNTIPKNQLNIIEGQHLYLSLEEGVVNIVNCTLTIPSDTNTYYLLENGEEVPENTDTGIHYWGSKDEDDCGVHFTFTNSTSTGIWKLTAHNETDISNGELYIIINKEQEYEMDDQVFILGAKNVPTTIGPSYATYYQATNPVGRTYLLQTTENLFIETVTHKTEGNWTLKYAIEGRTEETVGNMTVLVIPESTVQTSVQNSSLVDKGVDLLCKFTKTIMLCRFTRPDGTGMLMTQGIGNGEYSYYGTGFDSNECGITIHNPSLVDYGIWQCEVQYQYTTTWGGEFITLPNPSGVQVDIQVTSEEKRVVGLTESTVQLLCHAQAKLAACWFRRPSGIFYAPMGTDYYGHGLDVGDCGINFEIPKDDEFEEDWTCNMAIADNENGDLTTTITLRATKNKLTAVNALVEASSDESTSLLCQSTKTSIPLKYCRFIRPDGQGITFLQQTSPLILDTYSYHGDGIENGDCGIHISSVREEDFGEWICAATLINDLIESSISITLESDSLTVAEIVGIAVGSFLLLCIIIAVVYVVIRKRSK